MKKLQPQYLEFITATSQIFCTKTIRTNFILVVNKFFIKLKKVVYTFKCNSKLILFNQLRESTIIYIDNFNAIILIEKRQVIIHKRQNRNLFIFDSAILNKIIQVIQLIILIIMMIQSQKYPIHLINKNKYVVIWHCKFDHRYQQCQSNQCFKTCN